LGFALPVTGELSGTWGDTVNNSITQLEEDAIAGVATASVTSGNWTLSTTGSGASNEARKAILIPTGTPGVSRNILAPNSSKAYIVDNQSDAAVVLKGVTGPTAGITIAAGEECLAVWNGSDFVKVASSLITALSGTLGPANGGTGVANNAASTLTISGNFPTTLTVGASTSVTLPPSGSLGYLNIPLSGAAKTSSYTLAVGDIGELIQVNTGGSIIVPDATFAAGDAVVIFNNTSGAITLTMTITTAYIGGTDADKATISLATRGICNVLFISGTVCVVTGNVT
jgi:hypothetical protein